MDHRELKQIKARRGFVESPTGGFVRDLKWMAPRLAHMARMRQELSTRLAGLDQQLGIDAQQWAEEPGQHQKPPDAQPEPSTPTKLSWRERIRLAAVISWRLMYYGTLESVRDLTHG